MRTILVLLATFAVPSLSCPDFWTSFGSSCYKVSESQKTWYNAQQYCKENGGYLVEINDETEQTAMYSFLSLDLNYWIGLSDAAQEGVWVWQESFTVAEYTFWATGEPNNGSDGGEDCAYLFHYSLEWVDAPCDRDVDGDAPYHAVCEAPNE